MITQAPTLEKEYMTQKKNLNIAPKVLVSGHQGFIGSHLFDKLTSLGFQVAGADLKSDIDIRSYVFHENYEYIFHCAAKASIPASFENPVESHTHNVYGTLRILEYARKIGAKVIFSSSSSIYGEAEIPTSEIAPYNPLSPYAIEKILAELYCEYYWSLGVKSVSLRYFNVFGERQEIANSGDGTLVIPTFLKQHKEGKPFTIVGTGKQKRDFVYVQDVVSSNIAAAHYLDIATHYEAFNIGSGENISINELVNMIDPEHLKVNLPPRREPFVNKADISKAKEVLGWEPTMFLKEWIEKLLA
jgi:UDP-glucose 4-epimerase